MREAKCLKINYNKQIARVFIDFIIIFVLFYLIAFIESIMQNFAASFKYVIQEKKLLFFVIMAISFLLSLFLAFMDMSSRCLSIKYDEEKIIFVKRKKEESMKLVYGLIVRSETKIDGTIFSFRQDKRVVNVYLSKTDGSALINQIRDKGITINCLSGKKSQNFKNTEEKTNEEDYLKSVNLENINSAKLIEDTENKENIE